MLDITQFGTTSGWVDAVLDPDGTITNKGDSIVLLLYYNDRVMQYGDLVDSSYTPNWFSY